MVRRRVSEAAAAMEGEVIGGETGAWFDGVAIDSRRVRGEELFFALPGERSDGHRHVAHALERGAAAVVVHQPVVVDRSAALIRVEDTYLALHALTRWARQEVPQHLVAITGSVGKTTTKELLAAMLGHRYRVAKSPGNLNNLYGFPVALLGIAEDTEWMVAEMGMSKPGELGEISRLGRPDVALFLNVRPAHLEFFGGLSAIADAKAELLEGLDRDGLVVANARDPEVRRIAERYRESVPGGRVRWYALSGGASRGKVDLLGRDVTPRAGGEPGFCFFLESATESAQIDLPLHGEYNVENCLAAAACAHALGLSLDEIAAAVREVEPPPRRGVVHHLSSGITLIDDSYNSNPEALSRALGSARRLPAQRHWVVLGEMRELGEDSPRFHRRAGEEAARLGFSPVVCVGEGARPLEAGAGGARGARTGSGKERGEVETRWFPDADSAADWVSGELRAGDLLLVKGSRGVGLEVVSDAVLVRQDGSPGGKGEAH